MYMDYVTMTPSLLCEPQPHLGRAAPYSFSAIAGQRVARHGFVGVGMARTPRMTGASVTCSSSRVRTIGAGCTTTVVQGPRRSSRETRAVNERRGVGVAAPGVPTAPVTLPVAAREPYGSTRTA